MGFRGQLRFFTAGTAGRTAGLKAQCSFFDWAGVSSGCETTPATADNAINTIPFTHVRVWQKFSVGDIPVRRLQSNLIAWLHRVNKH